MSLPVSIAEAVAGAAAQLRNVSESARLEAEILTARAIDVSRSYLFAHPEDELDEGALKRLRSTLERRLKGEPMAYIRGHKEFWSLELMVTPATLVPRPETEILVDHALRLIPRRASWPVLDLGTGSGAIALAIANERPMCSVTATDVSAEALNVAAANANHLGLCNLEFLQGSWTAPVVNRRFSVIVSNPPYVRENDPHLDALRAEPRHALVAGPSGFEAIESIARDCTAIVSDGGTLLLEHGSDQAGGVRDILSSYGWETIRCYDDHAGLPRVTGASFKKSEMT